MNTLLHICCAPCANQCIEVLRADGYDVTGLWYNPNIHPFTEYRARRNCLRAYAETIALPLLERNDYGLRPFVRTVVQDLADRCVKCYEMRLFEAARQAREGGFDSFTSSLFISPYQKHALMRDVAERAGGIWRRLSLPGLSPVFPGRTGASEGAGILHAKILRLYFLRGRAVFEGVENHSIKLYAGRPSGWSRFLLPGQFLIFAEKL